MNNMYISERQDFSKIFNVNNDTGKTFNSIFQIPKQSKNRKFTGAVTKRGYGHVFDPTNSGYKTMNSALTDGGDGGDGGGAAMGESINKKFTALIEALRTTDNSIQIDFILSGFNCIR